jgi:flavin-dependent dehydrogenase
VNAYDAIVIGAGPAGAATALLFARRGMRVAVVEKTSFPRRKVCGEFISAPTWALLRDLGIASALEAEAGPAVDRVGLFARDAVLDAPMPINGVRDELTSGRAIAREVLDTTLLEMAAAEGAEVMQPRAVEAVEAVDGGFEVRVREEAHALHARIVVAAHGSWERGNLPSQVLRARARASDLLGFKANFSNAKLAAGVMPLVLFPGGYGGMVHGAHGLTGFSCCIRRDALARCRRDHRGLAAGEAVITHVMESCRGVREALDGAHREGAWLSAGPIQPGTRSVATPGYFVVGNAAGEAHPLIAEGISMAIQSARLLDERLAGGYAHAWRSEFATRVRASSVFAALTLSPFTDAASVALMRRVPSILTWGARLGGKAA